MDLENFERGIFVDFEGIDGSGTSTQVHELTRRVETFNKYQDVLRTHEPWKNKNLKTKIETDKDAYTDPEETANLFVGDRTDHSYILIRPNILAGTDVFCSRYKMSTCAFQWAQGVSLEKLLQMHENRGILVPDKVYFLNVSKETAARRMENRERKEKFERNGEFIDKLIANYHRLIEMAQENPKLFGKVVKINGEQSIEEVADEIYKDFLPFYKEFKGFDFHYSSIPKK